MAIAHRAAFASLLCFLGSAFAAPVDYTGFWKEDCSDPYGLQIKPYEGRYTVTFCGPGGCGKINPSSTTSIEGDKGYEVLGPDKIKIIYAEKYAPIYTKCTTETNPMLEYSAADQDSARKGLAVTAVAHLAYVVLAVLAYIFAHRRSGTMPSVRRRVVRSGIAALLFSPGIYLTWPFANPTFALLALVFSIPTIAQGTAMLPYFSAQLMYSLGPILVVWVGLFVAGHVRNRLSTTNRT